MKITKNYPLGDNAEKEHILACLSPAPSNAKIIETAARMAAAFDGDFTALYVQTPEFAVISDADKKRLEAHIKLAESKGAEITTVYGDDVSYQIAEFARLSAVTKIVIGRSNTARRHFWNKPALTERLASLAPNLDIHIIPDSSSESKYHVNKKLFSHYLLPTVRDLMTTLFFLAAATCIGQLFLNRGFTEANIITVYILGVLLTSLFTKSHACSFISSLASVLIFNFFFTEPRLTLHAYEPGYPVTFAIMLIASLITGSLANKLKDHAKQSAQSAFRTKVLFETNQLLQKAEDDSDIINITASQLLKLLDRDITVYPETDGKLSKGYLFETDEAATDRRALAAFHEKSVAEWVFIHNKRAGAMTDQFGDARCLYLAIRINNKVYGVVGIYIGSKTLDSFEYSMVLSILGECALAIENSRNAAAKEKAAVLAKNEQLRANLLRSISHDLRTPLTSISGNAGNLLSNYDKLDADTRMQMFTDIYDDSMWLISLVENLLSVTRIEEGRMNLNTNAELIDDVIEEALKHIDRKSSEHHIKVDIKDELMLAKMDVKLIMQVIINIVDNAVKYTQKGSVITVSARKKESLIYVCISDDGPGIPDRMKPQVFKMFFTGENQIADSRRSLGLGLCLCRSIINAHGGEITLTDNKPHGCVFTFTLPSEEVKINE
ncbi:MAG: DUF4118 domain-containing protein [Clostridiales bacterium]|nr:DUF4118 domain-containing protein [Clostridiales bacterium]MDY3746744.1 DUF4118 domain-containing protein [Lachnospiraceae bacterium]